MINPQLKKLIWQRERALNYDRFNKILERNVSDTLSTRINSHLIFKQRVRKQRKLIKALKRQQKHAHKDAH